MRRWLVPLKITILLQCLCPYGALFALDADAVLSAGQAFQLTVKPEQANRVLLAWTIAPGYYLYRDKLKFSSLTPGITVNKPDLPAGKNKNDPFLGMAEIYQQSVEIDVHLQRHNPKLDKLALEVTFQGCAEAGVCYMPTHKTVEVDLPEYAGDSWRLSTVINQFTSLITEQDSIAASFNGKSTGLVMLSFLGFGLLLAFTPCVFPMIPILSGIIVGQSEGITTLRAFTLSLGYVLASALTYTLFGVLAGLFGNNLQVFFQEPMAIIAFSGVFVLLALSMFGVFHLQMPAFLQTRLLTASSKQQGGNLLGAAIMGVLSALAVGPCVTAPLAGALIYIGQTGDALLGGLALFFLGLGMGIPLLIIGTSAGKLLPKSGRWMDFTKAFFGMGLLAVAVWLLNRIATPAVSLILWGLLLIIPIVYLGWKRFWKSAVTVALIYGLLLTAGIFTTQQRDTLQLLCTAAIACETTKLLPFQQVSSHDELGQVLAAARAKRQWVMLDFYADWCVACKEMTHYTFADPRVQDALAKAVLLQADVTQNTPDHQTLMKRFELVGPPAILFFNPDQQAQQPLRIIGYRDSENFLAQLNHFFH
ncbi:MAG: protein-disulfide reductase DsbD [Methylovulum sp.]|nr:protein-disulfide reductase DsbD [Methylovulum sp.]